MYVDKDWRCMLVFSYSNVTASTLQWLLLLGEALKCLLARWQHSLQGQVTHETLG
jgi:hypothetical protein